MAEALHYTYIQEEEARTLHTGGLGGRRGVGGTWQEHNVIHTYRRKRKRRRRHVARTLRYAHRRRRRKRKRSRRHVARTLHYTYIQTHTHTLPGEWFNIGMCAGCVRSR